MCHDTVFSTCRQILAAVVTGCFFLSFAWAAEPQGGYQTGSPYTQEIATVGATQGDAKIQRAGEAQFKRVQTNAPLYLSDFLATGRASKIWWKGSDSGVSGSGAWAPFPEAAHGSLGENSVFGFVSFQRISLASKFVGQVPKGIVRFIKKLPRTDPPSSFSIATPTAWIEVVETDRAADYVVETTDDSRTTITVIWGQVRVRNISDQLASERILSSCQEVDVEKDKEPGEIRWVSTDTMKNLIKRTTIPKTLPEDVPSCERIKSEVIRAPGAVYLPPPGVVIIPIPVPPPPPKDCPCPCPPNYQLVPGHGCVPCRGAVNNISKPNVAGAEDARLKGGSETRHPDRPSSCTCDCPCPQGQVLLPGRGCVPECPPGFIVNYDASEYPPYRCPFCVQRSTPPTSHPGCETDQQCGRCETCTSGNCTPMTCPRGQVLNPRTCSCEPIGIPHPCENAEQCPPCQQCREGKCVAVIACGPQQRLNRDTCQCQPVTTDGEPLSTVGPPPECQANSDCPSGQICRRGKCVKKPPLKPRTTGEEGTTDELTTPRGLSVPTIPRRGLDIGIGIGGGGTGGTPKGPSGPPQRIRPGRTN
jgi:Cys-rich repeat protein